MAPPHWTDELTSSVAARQRAAELNLFVAAQAKAAAGEARTRSGDGSGGAGGGVAGRPARRLMRSLGAGQRAMREAESAAAGGSMGADGAVAAQPPGAGPADRAVPATDPMAARPASSMFDPVEFKMLTQRAMSVAVEARAERGGGGGGSRGAGGAAAGLWIFAARRAAEAGPHAPASEHKRARQRHGQGPPPYPFLQWDSVLDAPIDRLPDESPASDGLCVRPLAVEANRVAVGSPISPLSHPAVKLPRQEEQRWLLEAGGGVVGGGNACGGADGGAANRPAAPAMLIPSEGPRSIHPMVGDAQARGAGSTGAGGAATGLPPEEGRVAADSAAPTTDSMAGRPVPPALPPMPIPVENPRTVPVSVEGGGDGGGGVGGTGAVAGQPARTPSVSSGEGPQVVVVAQAGGGVPLKSITPAKRPGSDASVATVQRRVNPRLIMQPRMRDDQQQQPFQRRPPPTLAPNPLSAPTPAPLPPAMHQSVPWAPSAGRPPPSMPPTPPSPGPVPTAPAPADTAAARGGMAGLDGWPRPVPPLRIAVAWGLTEMEAATRAAATRRCGAATAAEVAAAAAEAASAATMDTFQHACAASDERIQKKAALEEAALRERDAFVAWVDVLEARPRVGPRVMPAAVAASKAAVEILLGDIAASDERIMQASAQEKEASLLAFVELNENLATAEADIVAGHSPGERAPPSISAPGPAAPSCPPPGAHPPPVAEAATPQALHLAPELERLHGVEVLRMLAAASIRLAGPSASASEPFFTGLEQATGRRLASSEARARVLAATVARLEAEKTGEQVLLASSEARGRVLAATVARLEAEAVAREETRLADAEALVATVAWLKAEAEAREEATISRLEEEAEMREEARLALVEALASAETLAATVAREKATVARLAEEREEELSKLCLYSLEERRLFNGRVAGCGQAEEARHAEAVRCAQKLASGGAAVKSKVDKAKVVTLVRELVLESKWREERGMLDKPLPISVTRDAHMGLDILRTLRGLDRAWQLFATPETTYQVQKKFPTVHIYTINTPITKYTSMCGRQMRPSNILTTTDPSSNLTLFTGSMRRGSTSSGSRSTCSPRPLVPCARCGSLQYHLRARTEGPAAGRGRTVSWFSRTSLRPRCLRCSMAGSTSPRVMPRRATPRRSSSRGQRATAPAGSSTSTPLIWRARPRAQRNTRGQEMGPRRLKGAAPTALFRSPASCPRHPRWPPRVVRPSLEARRRVWTASRRGASSVGCLRGPSASRKGSTSMTACPTGCSSTSARTTSSRSAASRARSPRSTS